MRRSPGKTMNEEAYEAAPSTKPAAKTVADDALQDDPKAASVLLVTDDVHAMWQRGELLSSPVPAKGTELVLCEVAMDLLFSEAVKRLVESVGAEAKEEGDVVWVWRQLRRRDFALVGTMWKRREGIAVGLTAKHELWVQRYMALRDGSLRYYAQADSVDEWEGHRGLMPLADGVTMRHSTTTSNKEAQDALGSPTPYVLEIEAGHMVWLLAFETNAQLETWRNAISAAQHKTDSLYSFAYRVTSGTTTTPERQRLRYMILHRHKSKSAALERDVVLVTRTLDDAADIAFADALARREQQQGGDQSLNRLDPQVVADLMSAARRRSAIECATELEKARLIVDEERKKLDKLAAQLKPTYAAAKLMCPAQDVPALPPTDELFAGLADRPLEEIARRADEDVRTTDETAIVDRAFAYHMNDVAAACRMARRGIVARAAGIASTEVEKLRVSALAASVDRIRHYVDSACQLAADRKLEWCAAATSAVERGVWVGQESASAELWSAFKEAATSRTCCLAKFAVVNGTELPGTLYVCAHAVYFAPSTKVTAKLFSKAAAAVFSTGSPLKSTDKPPDKPFCLALSSVSQVRRVPSPIPLKTNALQLTTHHITVTLTLNAPGASVSALVDLLETCRRLDARPPMPEPPAPAPPSAQVPPAQSSAPLSAQVPPAQSSAPLSALLPPAPTLAPPAAQQPAPASRPPPAPDSGLSTDYNNDAEVPDLLSL